MKIDLIKEPVDELLRKFGAGSHKPGSGSAAALQGLLSAQLLRTVIELTGEKGRKKYYKDWLPELRRIKSEIETRIYPKLLDLFQMDSEQFGRTIDLRNARNAEKNALKRSLLDEQARHALMPATEIPVDIAKLCQELAEYAGYVFDHGFKSARGDAGVAQNGSIAAIGGCLAIIRLNLLSFEQNEWTEKIKSEADELKKSYNSLALEADTRINVLTQEVEKAHRYQAEITALLTNLPQEAQLTYSDIENTATQLQRIFWKYRDVIWKYKIPENPLDIINPKIAFKQLGYNFSELDYIGEHKINGEYFEIAGLINRTQKQVEVSKNFSMETQQYTAAHELGHIIFHKGNILHRDRALDGSISGNLRDLKEMQADKFAACFLMPQKQVKSIFKQRFSIDKFTADENTVFMLTNSNLATFKLYYPTKRDVSKLLASTDLAQIFRVSVEAMAIRLEELGLVDY